MVVVCGLALAAAGCGDDESDSAAGGSKASGSSDAGSPGLQAAQKIVDAATPLKTDFPPPGPPIEGAESKFKGKTVYYIPIVASTAFFQGEAKTVADALSNVGAKVRVCDGKVNPSSVAACLNQAADNNAAGVITDAIAVEFAEQAYRKVTDKKIPVVASQLNVPVPTDGSFGRYLARNEGNENGAQEASAAKLVVDSGGKGNVLMLNAVDIPTSRVASKIAQDTVRKYCPDCKVTTFDAITSGPKVGTSISSALLKNPDTEYFYSPYEAPTGALQLQALRQAAKNVKFYASSGDPEGLKRVAEGTQAEDTGTDPVAMGWNAVDALLRVATGMEPTNMKTNIRVFTKDNVPKDLSTRARDTGEWYSDMSYKDMYRKLWAGK